MPRAPRKLAELDAAAASCNSLSAAVQFALEDNWRLLVLIETGSSRDGSTAYELRAASAEGRRPQGEPWTSSYKKLSTALRMLARKFPGLDAPSDLQMSCRGGSVPTSTLKHLLRDGLAEAFGREPEPPPATPAVALDWVSVLRSGLEGVKKWNRLAAADRKAVDLSGADLGGCDLSGAKLRGVKAKGASFAGASLGGADLAEGDFSRAVFASADLTGAGLRDAQAPDADFRGAKLVRAVLRGGMFFGVSFAGANLTGADLSDANLARADLTGAALDGAALDRATFDRRTAWPSGFVIPSEVLFIGKGTDPRLSGQGEHAVAADVNGLVARLNSSIDPRRMARTMDMLRSGQNQLFAEVEPDHVRGIVRSQREENRVYSCVLTHEGAYACCAPDPSPCKGLRGEPCKHILVLVLGLARAGTLDPMTVDRWLAAARGQDHRWDQSTRNHVRDTLLRYRGAQAGEVDWRPTETIPEDFYAMYSLAGRELPIIPEEA